MIGITGIMVSSNKLMKLKECRKIGGSTLIRGRMMTCKIYRSRKPYRDQWFIIYLIMGLK